MVIQAQTVASPQTGPLLTTAYSFGAIALDIVFCSLYSPDHIRLFHPVCINTHTLSRFLNLLKSHCYPLIQARAMFWVTVIVWKPWLCQIGEKRHCLHAGLSGWFLPKDMSYLFFELIKVMTFYYVTVGFRKALNDPGHLERIHTTF